MYKKNPKNKRKHLSVLEGTAAAGFVDELLQHGAVHQPEGLCLRHLRQVVDAEAEAKPLQVLGTGTSRGSRSARREGGKERKTDATSEHTHIMVVCMFPPPSPLLVSNVYMCSQPQSTQKASAARLRPLEPVCKFTLWKNTRLFYFSHFMRGDCVNGSR